MNKAKIYFITNKELKIKYKIKLRHYNHTQGLQPLIH